MFLAILKGVRADLSDETIHRLNVLFTESDSQVSLLLLSAFARWRVCVSTETKGKFIERIPLKKGQIFLREAVFKLLTVMGDVATKFDWSLYSLPEFLCESKLASLEMNKTNQKENVMNNTYKSVLLS